MRNFGRKFPHSFSFNWRTTKTIYNEYIFRYLEQVLVVFALVEWCMGFFSSVILHFQEKLKFRVCKIRCAHCNIVSLINNMPCAGNTNSSTHTKPICVHMLALPSAAVQTICVYGLYTLYIGS